MAAMIIRFESYNETEDVEQYLERLEMLLMILRLEMLLANGVKEDKKVGHMLSNIGAKAYAVLKNLLAPDELKDSSLASIKEKLIAHYKPKPPVIRQRFVFHQRIQNTGESINEFVMELRCLAPYM